jgi:hypothetical protein
MPQQINLRTPILLTQRHYLSASTMAWALGVIWAFSGALGAYWIWSLEASSTELRRTLSAYARDRERLQAAIKDQQASALPAPAGLVQELEARRALLAQREQVQAELVRGLLHNGDGHAARLRLVARTIPAEVWVTEMRADERQMEVHGFTLEPAALNQWVARLGEDPLLKGYALSAVKVERVAAETAVAAPVAPAGARGTRPSWSFTLVSVAVPGGRP